MNDDIDTLLADAAEDYAKKLKGHEPEIRTILQKYSDPTEDQVENITKVVYRHLPFAENADAIKSQRKMLIGAHENLAKVVKSYQETISGLVELLFRGPGLSILEDIKEEIETRDITRDQFIEALLVLTSVAKNADITLKPAHVGPPIEEISRFACEVNHLLPEMYQTQKAEIISLLLRDLANVRVKSENIRRTLGRCPKQETSEEKVLNSFLYG